MPPEAKMIDGSPSPCAEKLRMFEELSAAMAAIMALNNREMEAVIAGKLTDLDRFAIELRQARERKDTLMFAYTNHVQRHGC